MKKAVAWSVVAICGAQGVVADSRSIPLGPEATLMSRRILPSTRQYKPSLGEDFRQHLPTFVFHNFTESCEDVVDAMQASDVPFDVCMHLLNIYHTIAEYQIALDGNVMQATPTSPVESENHEMDAEWRKEILSTSDKNIETFLKSFSLNDIPHGPQQSEGGLNGTSIMERLVKCTADEKSGRTLVQKLVEFGMEKPLKTDFVMELLRGVGNYDPALVLDSEGNTLLHLAVLSKASNAPQTLLQLIFSINAEFPESRINSVYWIVAALEHMNRHGKKPYDLVKDGSSVKQYLKSQFRSCTYNLKFLLNQSNRLIRRRLSSQSSSSLTPTN